MGLLLARVGDLQLINHQDESKGVSCSYKER
jgi:hypothetical protein